MSLLIEAATERATDDAARRPFEPGAPDGYPRTRHLAIGDPQAPLTRLLEILERRGALGPDGRLAPEVALLSIGDHFDWGGRSDRAQAVEDGPRVLAWLAAHPADQVTLLLGNHDLGRVGELAGFDDASFARAQAEADAIYFGEPGPSGELEARGERRFAERWRVPTAEVVSRDLSAFRASQAELVELLLRERRFRAAAAHGAVLFTHAGVTRDELRRLGLGPLEESDGRVVAEAIEEALASAVAGWTSGSPLVIPHLHAPGVPGDEGRGMFYHRPSNPERSRDAASPDLFDGPPRRRFDPRHLPLGLVQVIGHIQDKKCRELLTEAWCDDLAPVNGPLRHLVTDGREVRYALGVPEAVRGDRSTMFFIDGGMWKGSSLEGYELLDADTLRAA